MDLEEKSSYNEKKDFVAENKEIAYQNKDITSKLLAENFKGKSFKVYGLDLPEITTVLPTNIPVVKANELRLDNLFGLADGTVAIVDYESQYKKEDKIKYLNYLVGIANRFLKENRECPMLRMIVIYTGDIKRENISEEYDIGALKLRIESAFLSELNSKSIWSRLTRKVKNGQLLTDEEMMEFIILPLSYKTTQEKKKNLAQIIEYAVQIENKEQQLFVLSGILTFTDKIIDKEMIERIKEAIQMTQIAQLYEEEKRQAVTQVAKIFEEEKQQAISQLMQQYEEEKRQAASQLMQQYEEEKHRETEKMIIRMLKKNYSPEEIASIVTDCSVEQIEKLIPVCGDA